MLALFFLCTEPFLRLLHDFMLCWFPCEVEVILGRYRSKCG